MSKQIKFIITRPGYPSYSDCLYFRDDETPTNEEIETLKEQRYGGFKNAINNPAPPDEDLDGQ